MSKKEPPLIVIVANVHLSYNRKRGDIKLAQMNLILLTLAELKKYFDFMKVKTITFLCGDFNSTPSSAIFQLITQGSYNCKAFPISKLSGQHSSVIRIGPKKQLIPDIDQWYMENVNKMMCMIGDSAQREDLQFADYKFLSSWYMGVLNPYVIYDFIKKKIKIKSKLPSIRITEYSEKLKTLNNEQRQKLRELFCNSEQEVDDLMDIDAKDSNLFTFILHSPIKFKNGYSEVGRVVKDYICSSPNDTLKYYNPTKLKAEELIGEEFNGIAYEKLRSSKISKNHTMESPFSHCSECLMKCDYIFFEGEGLIAVKEYEIPLFKQIANMLCPCENIPSDHFPIAITFIYDP